ncbi:DUF4430 domain-containing protein [Sporolactobacillus shoreae]|uniref:DUF4430 domain-containing protein n=1 Tax=Sporolactobacillus shoreae TaxID=1465501 RepID=A0A4Z0GRA9_9BACL|nr:DUF4430 domain-containing protein [Sporolactobacillus shoreae]TGA99880.1 DUF4430 domain-containing protein [Sporolactobacillus shoreae]
MKKTLITFVIPILAIVTGIGLVIGSFQVQTKTAPSSAPITNQDISSQSSVAPDSHNTEKKSPDPKEKKERESDRMASAASSENTKSDVPEVSKKSSVNNQSSKSGTIKTNESVTHESDQTKSSQQISASSNSSSRPASIEGKVSVTIHGLNGFNTQGSVIYQSNDSVFSELQRFTYTKNIEFSYSGFGSSIYVSSINNQKAGQTSPASGWMYTVNGKAPNISAGAYRVRPNDTINWYYSK